MLDLEEEADVISEEYIKESQEFPKTLSSGKRTQLEKEFNEGVALCNEKQHKMLMECENMVTNQPQVW